jgi:hypothetical protein
LLGDLASTNQTAHFIAIIAITTTTIAITIFIFIISGNYINWILVFFIGFVMYPRSWFQPRILYY